MTATTANPERTKYRKLRIAFSVACGILCLLLIVLWVRSYWIQDSIFKSHVKIYSNTGTVGFIATPTFSYPAWGWSSSPLNNLFGNPPQFLYWRDRDSNNQEYTLIHFPHWLLVVILSAIAYVPWLPRRFSLRTLLIATTLIAALLGTIVWAIK